MTIRELYDEIGGNYEQALKVMRADKLIDRYVRKLESSRLDEALNAAAETMDPAGLFESAHAMKGVCANLGLDALAQAAGVITEEFREGSPRKLSDGEVKDRLAELNALYSRAVTGIRRYAAGT